jgi:hypothetical protein
MRTLQEKYNGIQEGTFSKDHFLAEARMQQPQLITRFNGYDDAVQILKNRGMIQEARVAYDVPMIDNQRAAFDKLSDLYFEYLRKYAKSKGDNTSMSNSQLGDKYREEIETKLGLPPHSAYADLAKELKNRGMIVEGIKEGLGDKQYLDALRSSDANSIESAKKILKRKFKDLDDKNIEHLAKEWAKRSLDEAKLTKKSLTDYRYKPTNDMDKYPYEQILRGLRVELEAAGVLGTPTPEEYSKALAKVSKNLAKDSIFYTNQVAGVNPKVDLHDKMVAATAKNTVDTFNGMKKAALKEGFKKLIKKVLSENSNDLADLFDADEEREERRYTTNDYGDHGPESETGDSFDNMDPENYNEEEFELHGEEDLKESGMGDVYLLAQESDTFEDFVQAIEQEYGPTSDVDELMYIWDNRRDLEDDLYEVRKAKSLSELLK